MLAKIWKKVLLAICILACIYNIMYKLVSRISLDEQLKSVINQSSIMDMFNDKEESTENEDSSKNYQIKANEVKSGSEKDNTIVVIY